MGTYEVICASRADCSHGGHVSAVGVTRKKETQHVDVSVVRLMLSSGDSLYVRDLDDKERIGLRKGKCECGVKTVRLDSESSDALDQLTSCS